MPITPTPTAIISRSQCLRIVASGNITGPYVETYYYSVISLFSMCTIVLLSGLNINETLTCDIMNAFPTKTTTEKIVFNSGPEFAPFGHAGNLLHIKTELYGLKRSGATFHYRISDDLTALSFVLSVGGCDIWMCNEGDYYSYVAWYCD